MNYIFNKYKYILFLITVIIISSIIFSYNYNIIEKFTGQKFTGCNDQILNNPEKSFYENRDVGDPPKNFYTCGEGKNINFFTDNKSVLEQPITLPATSHTLNNDNSCINTGIDNQDDIFILKDANTTSTCKSTTISVDKIGVENPIIYTCSDNPKSLDNYTFIGSGGFTSMGRSKLGIGYIRYLDKRCDDLNSKSVAINNFNDCLMSDGSNCQQYIDDLSIIEDEIQKGIDVGDFDTDTDGNLQFDDSGYLGGYAQDASQFALPDASLNEVNDNLRELKNVLAQENETSLETKSTFITYLFFIIILIITSIMIILNFIKPDIVTAEILIGYLIFLVLIIFITSNYFNVDYGPLNKFFRLHLGNAGSRNIFQTPGYSANL